MMSDLDYVRRERKRAMRLVSEARESVEMARKAVNGETSVATRNTFDAAVQILTNLISGILKDSTTK